MPVGIPAWQAKRLLHGALHKVHHLRRRPLGLQVLLLVSLLKAGLLPGALIRNRGIRFIRFSQLRAAPGAMRPAGLAGPVALRTRRQYAGAATGAEGVPLLHP